MSRTAQIAIALGVLCALLVGIIVGGKMGGRSESERFYSRANRTLDAVAPEQKAPEAKTEKDELMAAAKTVALAAIQCAADDDHSMMPGDASHVTKVWPYMPKNKPNDLTSFKWEYKGGRQDKLEAEQLSSTIPGRMTGATGDAVVYLDGRAEWKAR